MTIVSHTNHGRGFEIWQTTIAAPVRAVPRGWDPDARPNPVRRSAYRVTVVTTVDHPEKRDASFIPVSAGTRVVEHHYFDDCAIARRFYAAALAGESDFSSEYVSGLRFEARSLRADWSASVRTVRAPIERDRPMTVPHNRSHGSARGEFSYEAA